MYNKCLEKKEKKGTIYFAAGFRTISAFACVEENQVDVQVLLNEEPCHTFIHLTSICLPEKNTIFLISISPSAKVTVLVFMSSLSKRFRAWLNLDLDDFLYPMLQTQQLYICNYDLIVILEENVLELYTITKLVGLRVV